MIEGTYIVNPRMLLVAQWRDAIPQEVNFGVEETGTGTGTVTAYVNGNPINSGDEVLEGTEIVFTAHPDQGFRVKQWFVNGVPVDASAAIGTRATSNTFTLRNWSNETTVTVEFENDPSVGRDDVAFANLLIHPNPFVSEVTITGAANSVLEIVNALGAVVHTQPITNATEVIQLEQLSSGIYFFRVSRDGQSRTLQVVKR
jgi:hypothetical protein